MKTMQALVLTPADAGLLRATIETTLRDHSIQPVSLDQQANAGSVWMSVVTDAIQTADLIVADVSRDSPYVLYELGFAHALRKPVLLLWNMASGTDLPSDLAGYQMLLYHPEKLGFLSYQISQFLGHQQARLRPVA